MIFSKEREQVGEKRKQDEIIGIVGLQSNRHLCSFHDLNELKLKTCNFAFLAARAALYESIATVGEIRVWWRADFQSGSRVLKKVF